MIKEYYVFSNGKKVRADTMRRCVTKWQHTPRGISTIKKYKQEHIKEIAEYNKKYLIKRRKTAKKNKLCVTCFKTPTTSDCTSCQDCLNKSRERSAKKYKVIKKWKN